MEHNFVLDGVFSSSGSMCSLLRVSCILGKWTLFILLIYVIIIFEGFGAITHL